jgi:predicted ATP-grasp superfamily ATP-dependent carboligase
MKEAWDILNEYLQERFGGWKDILKTAFEKGVEAALLALEATKDEIIRVCKENKRLLEQLTKLINKSFTAAAATSKAATQVAANVLAKEATQQQTVKQTSKVSLKASMS